MDKSLSNSKQKVETKQVDLDTGMPDLPKKELFAITFAFLGINMAFSLQSSQMSRICQTIGANPNNLGFFFIFPPLMGMIVQPIMGKMSDRTWNRFGRRLPYLLFGTPIAALVLIMLPFSGSLGFGYGSMAAMIYAATAVCLMDLFSNICMQPSRMIVGDMVNNKQKNFAWSWQQVFSNGGGILATILPFIFTMFGMSNTAKRGVVPNTVIWSYLCAAAVLLFTGLWTVFNVKEYDPETYAKYHHIDPEEQNKSVSLWELIKTAPRAFWEINLVQLFSWFAIMYVWTYTTGTCARNIWHTSDVTSAGYQAAGNWYGILTAVYSIAGIVWGLIYAHAKAGSRKKWYTFGMIVGGLGLVWMTFVTTKTTSIIAMIMFGIGNFSINTIPFTLLTSSLNGKNEGAYLGLFNVGICVPQIVASLCSFFLFPLVGHNQPMMLLLGGISLLIGALAVQAIHEGVTVKEA
ncbi:MFS transporter [Limosilactobacillus reuteri]|jgi:maltose/moltooligosaccharide transporter|uniref:MFS transporter n=3 Tax=Limosilactobacillus reuteri TaxID=1598 RepID=A0A1C2GBG4_LIMRT|nr:SLC45 family MFS transporter [Limosilactobacillus reuteri]AGR63574.1 major facilitator transporter [Limosilactobacillus reuteri TD1]ANU52296.1 MFS transporter [Limosilactobacillus reuteri]EDX43418.1 major facilitator superfamily MFS_1 [Limosilactobacillus reuteri subsp. rodentium]MCC4332617.1 SLC45 family MFS transporter [Limosilactobacillus reuteri]MCC4345056.1 SLC45 family MFS transporter [Limosilactobacillus reuteri]